MAINMRDSLLGIAAVGGALVGCYGVARLGFALAWFDSYWPELFLRRYPIWLYELALVGPLVFTILTVAYQFPKGQRLPPARAGSLVFAMLAAFGGIVALSAAAGLREFMYDAGMRIRVDDALVHPFVFLATKYYGGVVASVAVFMWVAWRVRPALFVPRPAA